MAKKVSDRIVLRARCMYPHLHAAHNFPADKAAGKPPYFRVSLVFNPAIPSEADQIKTIMTAASTLANESFGTADFETIGCPLKPDPKNEKVAGCYVLKLKSLYAPDLVRAEKGPDGKWLPLIDMNKPADGDIIAVSASLYSWDTSGNRGISASPDNVMFIKSGDGPLGAVGGLSAEDAFGDIQPESEPAAPSATTVPGVPNVPQ